MPPFSPVSTCFPRKRRIFIPAEFPIFRAGFFVEFLNECLRTPGDVGWANPSAALHGVQVLPPAPNPSNILLAVLSPRQPCPWGLGAKVTFRRPTTLGRQTDAVCNNIIHFNAVLCLWRRWPKVGQGWSKIHTPGHQNFWGGE